MLSVIFNTDGSLNTLIVGESINQGSNNVNQLFAAIKNRSTSDYSCNVIFELPDGEIEQLAGASSVQQIGDNNYMGYLVSLSENVTRLAGNLKVNIKLMDLSNNVLCSYQITLKVNPTGYDPNETTITEAQYNALLNALNSFQLKYGINNLRYYRYRQYAIDDIDNLEGGQVVLFPLNDIYRFFAKNGNDFVELNDISNNIGLIVKNADVTDGLSSAELKEAKRKFCILIYTYNDADLILLKTREHDGQIVFTKSNEITSSDTNTLTFNEYHFTFNSSTGALIGAINNTRVVYTKDGADSTFAALSGNNNFSGTNVFDNAPQTSDTPDSDNDLTRKGYVDTQDQILQNQIDNIDISGDFIPVTEKGAANGVATLDENSKVPNSQLPDSLLGQVIRAGTLNIVDTAEEQSAGYNLYNVGYVVLTANAITALNLTPHSSLTINGLTITSSNVSYPDLVTYEEFFNAVITKGEKAVSMYLIMGSRVYKELPPPTTKPIVNCNFYYQANAGSSGFGRELSTGDWAVIDQVKSDYIIWNKIDNTDAVSSVNGKTGHVVITKSDLGLEYIEEDVAPAYDNTATYPVGSVVMYNGRTYKNTIAVDTAEDFDVLKWVVISVAGELENKVNSGDSTITGLHTYANPNNDGNLRFLNSYSAYFDFKIDANGYGQFAFSGYQNGFFFSSTEFSPAGNNKQDLGRNTRKYKDFYLAGLINPNASGYGLTLPDTTSWTANKEIATTEQTFNVINASDIVNDTLTQAQYDLITNGRPTLIKGLIFQRENIFLMPVSYLQYKVFYAFESFQYDYRMSISVYSINTSTLKISRVASILETDTNNGRTLANFYSINGKTIDYYLNNVYHYATNSTTELEYETINNISISADTIFTLATAPNDTYPEYKANITNTDNANAITITLTGVTKAKTNSSDIVITEGANTTVVIPADTTVEVSIQNGNAIIYDWAVGNPSTGTKLYRHVLTWNTTSSPTKYCKLVIVNNVSTAYTTVNTTDWYNILQDCVSAKGVVGDTSTIYADHPVIAYRYMLAFICIGIDSNTEMEQKSLPVTGIQSLVDTVTEL